MQFLHKFGNARLVVIPEDVKWREAQGGQMVPLRLKGKTIEFTEMARPWAFGEGTAYNGTYYTEDSEEIDFLLNHRTYGVDMIGIMTDGRLLTDENWIFEELEDGRVRCRLNGRIFANDAGAQGWKKTSKEYKELLDKFHREKAAASDIPFVPVGDSDRDGELGE